MSQFIDQLQQQAELASKLIQKSNSVLVTTFEVIDPIDKFKDYGNDTDNQFEVEENICYTESNH